MSFLHSDFIYSNRPRHRIRRHLVFWATCVCFFTLIYGTRPGMANYLPGFTLLDSYKIALFDALAFLPNHMLSSYVIIYLLIPRFLFREKYGQLLAGLVGIILVSASLSFVISIGLVTPFREYLGLVGPPSNFYYGLMAGLRGGLSVAGFAGAIKLAKHWYQKNQLNQRLEAEKLKAELQLLKSQVHPHFLFNTLNNLYSLTLLQSSEAPEVVLKLAGLLRYMLYECNVPKVPLAKELKLIQDYIELEKLRYGPRLDLSVNVQGEINGKWIAPLLLLPFLENSFKHGASEQLEQAWISLDLTVRGNTLKLKLMNALPEAPTVASLSPDSSGGIGLQNVRKRLELIYPDRHELKLTQNQEVFIVTLSLLLESEVRPVPESPVPATSPHSTPPAFSHA